MDYKRIMFGKWPFTNFTEQDWDCYGGCEGDPLIARLQSQDGQDWEVIVDANCISLHCPIYDSKTDELTCLEYQYDYKAKNVDPWEVLWLLSHGHPNWFEKSRLQILGFEEI
jgi:hypothetical protein